MKHAAIEVLEVYSNLRDHPFEACVIKQSVEVYLSIRSVNPPLTIELLLYFPNVVQQSSEFQQIRLLDLIPMQQIVHHLKHIIRVFKDSQGRLRLSRQGQIFLEDLIHDFLGSAKVR